VAFVVVDPDFLTDFQNTKNLQIDDKMMNKDDLITRVQKSITRVADEHDLSPLERPKELKLLKDPFTPENNLMTPTMKIKRNVAVKVYEKDIEYLYALEANRNKKGFLGSMVGGVVGGLGKLF